MRFVAILMVAGGISASGSTACAKAGDDRVALSAMNSGKPDTLFSWTQIADTLRKLVVEDQAGRDGIARAVVANDTAVLKRMMHGDSLRTRWLKQLVELHGWPSAKLVGDSSASSAWLLLQHSTDLEFQRATLPSLDSAAERGEIRRADVAMLTDRVRVHTGRTQLYGSSFSVIGGKLVADSIEDLAGLDERRKKMGLPLMKDYVEKLAEMYEMPVVWPPKK